MSALSDYCRRGKFIKFSSLVHASSGFSWSFQPSWAGRELLQTRNQRVFFFFLSAFVPSYSVIKNFSTIDALSLVIRVRDITLDITKGGTHIDLVHCLSYHQFFSLSQPISSCPCTHAILTSSIVDHKTHRSQQYLPGMFLSPSSIRIPPG